MTLKLDIQPIACGDQLLVSDAETGEMYATIDATVTPDCKFTHVELLDAIYQELSLGEMNIKTKTCKNDPH